ncbi:MAG: putative hydrolases or acyltransferases (alpha/beta hydrolase superfamily) [Phormidesmis priestleyi Ana]|uniref:Putative hydrolases or acyltransferases (Alpha/beta hydrolase superfamily) n=1 Tax=Phormidesmis priestleyi Ana TaxID=1666911 RepID=A0A0N8KN02_9CYAN|nr:MAG: putative hydrolases or acyltransferases (alpha/beta hydrolase superfamily) [Phormidesmis priestleyi Ana]
MSYISVNGVDHYYQWISTQDHPGNDLKPVMVFLHGWAGSARYWESTAEAIKDEYDCLLYDMRGFGRSHAPTPEVIAADPSLSSLESFAEDLVSLLNALSLTQPIYMNAHSLGGTVGLYFLDRYPERVKKAILTCNGSFPYQKWAFEAFYFFGAYVVAFRPKWLGQIPLAPQMFMSRFLKQTIPLAEKQAFLNDFLMADGPTSIGTLKAAVSKHATEVMPVAFANLQVPTLMISGEYDKITPAKLGREAASISEQMQYVLMPNTAHFPMLEDAENYLRITRAFLTEAEQPVGVSA